MNTIVEKSMLGRAWVVSDCDGTSNDDDLMRCVLRNRGVADADTEKFLRIKKNEEDGRYDIIKSGQQKRKKS